MSSIFVSPSLLQAAAPASDAPAEAKAKAALNGVHRIVFLGDSITQGGDYVIDFECWLFAHGLTVEAINIGLSSETASDLTTEENAEHLAAFKFGHPFVSERLDRALAATKPDLLFACYGMNDAWSLPAGDVGTKRFAAAVTHLCDAATKAGVKRIVICTPPVHDNKASAKPSPQDENLSAYTAWLLTKRADGWDVVDFHTPMRKALDAERTKNPEFQFASDGTHPGREGHWLMAREILAQMFGAKLDGVAAAEDLFPARGAEIRKLLSERMVLLSNAWLSQTGHKRPGVAGAPGSKPALSVDQARKQADEISAKIQTEISVKP